MNQLLMYSAGSSLQIERRRICCVYSISIALKYLLWDRPRVWNHSCNALECQGNNEGAAGALNSIVQILDLNFSLRNKP